MFNDKKVLITGSEGFIGSHLADTLKDNCRDLFCIDKINGEDLCNEDYVSTLPDVDIIFHMAARNGTKWFYEKPFSVLENCTTPTLNLIKRYKNSNVKFIYASSCEIYADSTEIGLNKIPTSEDISVLFSNPKNLRWSYAAGKYIGELAVMSAAREFNLNYLVLRYHNIYGPRQVDHFIPEFYSRLKDGDCSLKGWENTRAFCYISDAIEMTLRAAQNNKVNDSVIHIGDDKEVSIKEVAEIILDISDIDQKLVLNNAPEGSVSRRCPDLTLAKDLDIYHNAISIREGLIKTIEELK